MDIILTIIAVLGLGALLISVFIFAIAARRFVSDEAIPDTASGSTATYKPRTREDRRQQAAPHVFPININGRTIAYDRRTGADRRDMGR